MKKIFCGFPAFFDFCFRPKTLAKKPWFFCECFDSGNRAVGVGLRILHESAIRIFFNNRYDKIPWISAGFVFCKK